MRAAPFPAEPVAAPATVEPAGRGPGARLPNRVGRGGHAIATAPTASSNR